MASPSTASTRIPPKTAPPQMKSRVPGTVDPYGNFKAPPPRNHTAVNWKKKCSSVEAELHSQDLEIYKKDKLRARRSTDPANPLRVKDYEKHRERVRTATACVDSSCPIIPKAAYDHSAAFHRKIANFSRIERENAFLLRRIAAVLEGNGTVDNHLKAGPKIRSSHNRAQARQHALLQITFANLALVKRIQEQKPLYSRKEQLKDYAEKEKIMAELSYYPLFWKVKKPEGLEQCEMQACEDLLLIPKPLFCVGYAKEPGQRHEKLLMEVRAGRAGIVPKPTAPSPMTPL